MTLEKGLIRLLGGKFPGRTRLDLNEKTLLEEALKLPPEQRTAYLDRSCEDRPDLRAVVETFLATTSSTGEGPAPAHDKTCAMTAESESIPEFRTAAFPNSVHPDKVEKTIGAEVSGDEPGRSFGDYELLSVLGRGGMGVVYKARQVSLKRHVALKMMQAGAFANERERRRFRNEVEAIALLDHPAIVPVYEVGEHQGQPFFSMKLIEGETLAARLTQFQDNPREATAILIPVAQAVQHAHERGVLHRDLKPANILLDDSGGVYVADFGLAKRSSVDQELTNTGELMGSPAYMSPEQATGTAKGLSSATDVYGLGTILYSLLTGVAPFTGESVLAVIDSVRNKIPVGPRNLNPRVPQDLELICLKALEKRPVDRYSSVNELLADLQRFELGEPVSVRAPGMLERIGRWISRKPLVATAWALGTLALVLGGLGGFAGWQWRRAETARSLAQQEKEYSNRAERQALQDREKAEQARDLAVFNAHQATQSRQEAHHALNSSLAAQQRLARFEYGTTMRVAHQEWRDHNVQRARALIESTEPRFRNWEWHFLNRLLDQSRQTLSGHSAAVRTAWFSPDGSRAVTISRDQTARIWDLTTGSEVRKLPVPEQVLLSAEFSLDGTLLLTSGPDHTAQIWDAVTGELLRSLRGHLDTVNAATFSRDGTRIITASADSTARIWNTVTGEQLHLLQGPAGDVNWAAFHPGGKSVVTAHQDGTVRIWDADTAVEVRSLPAHSGWVRTAMFSPDGSLLVSAGEDGTAAIWDESDGHEIRRLEGHNGEVFSAVFSPDGSRVVTSSWDGTARIWQTATGRLGSLLKGHSGGVSWASFSPDGTRIMTAGEDGTAKLWEAGPRIVEFQALLGHQAAVHTASFSPDSSRLVTAGADTVAKVWETSTGQELFALRGHTGGLWTVSFSPDGTQILTGSDDKTLRFWDAATGNPLRTIQRESDPLIGAWFSPDGRNLLVVRVDQTAEIQDIATGNVLAVLKGHENMLLAAAYSRQGTSVITGSADSSVRIWDADSGALRQVLTGHTRPVTAVGFHPEGRQAVSSGIDGLVKIWDIQAGRELLTLQGHTRWVTSAIYSPDGARILTASEDQAARLWDSETGAEVLTLRGHTKRLTSALFSPDGTRIVTTSEDRTARLWNSQALEIEAPGQH